MPGNMRKLMGEVPRAFVLLDKEPRAEKTPIGTQPISEPEQMRRLEPLMGLIARGDVPLDDTAARAVAAYANGFHKRVR
ncbi:MAG TPA: hypothetical protein VGJ60_20490 [Chloroflexota bacterium]